jgi:hypothetical protein
MPKHESSGQAPTPCCFLLFLPLVIISTPISIVDTLLVVKQACMHMRWHEGNGQDPTPCCFLLFLLLVVISTSISIVDTLLVLKHASMHMRWHEWNGQATNPCCLLLFLPLVVIFTPNSVVDKWLWLKMHACMHVHALTWIKWSGPQPLLLPAVSIAGLDVKRKCSFRSIQAVAVAELG